MRKRTLVDLTLLILLLAVAWRVWSGPFRRSQPPRDPEISEAQPTPRVQDLMRRSSGDTESDAPQTSLPSRALPEERTGISIPAAPALLLVNIRNEDGSVPEGDLFVSSEDGSFQQAAPGGRLVLQSEPGILRLYAGVEDADGMRVSPLSPVHLQAGESTELLLEIPAPRMVLPGFRLQPGDLYAEVLNVMPGSPAALAGLEAGDAVLAINQVPVAGLTADQLESLLLGPQDEALLLRLVIREEDGSFSEVEALIGR